MHSTGQNDPVPYRSGASESPPADTDLGGLMAILSRNARSILLSTLAGLGLAILYLTMATPIYESTVTVLIDPRSRKIVSDEVVQGGLGSDLVLVESQVPIITSDTVLRRAVQKLAADPETDFRPQPVVPGMVEKLKELVRGPRPVVDPELAAVEELAKSVIVKRAQKTYVVDIQVSSSSPLKAALAANAIADAYLADQTAAKTEEAQRANKLIDARLGELTAQVRRAETRMDEFKKANRILNSEGGVLNEQQLGKLSAELASARAVAAEAKARFEQTSAAAKGKASVESLPEAMKSPVIQRLRDQYTQVARREAALNSQLQARHPVLIEVRSQLNEIKSQIAAEMARVSQGSKSEYAVAAAREKELVRIIESAKEDVARTNTAQIKLREIEREADASRGLLQAYLARAKETLEQSNTSTPEARVISTATVPSRPSKPGKLLITSLALLGGLGLGIARALATDHFDGAIRTSAGINRAAGLSPIAELPNLAGRSLVQRLRDRLASRSAAHIEAAGFSELLLAIGDTDGRNEPRFRQAVLRLLARIKADVPAGEPLTVLLGGAHKGAGTSATALAIGYAAALSGDRVLLVDASSTDAGLSEVFAKTLRQDEAIVLDRKEHLKRITSQDANSGLSFLPIALADLRHLKADQRRRLAAGITSMSLDYDLVLIDGGPLLDDESALSLLPATDRILLVAKAGETTRLDLLSLADLLEQSRDRVAGVVLNGI
jgi:polysaccharide biosynthesis transport protein